MNNNIAMDIFASIKVGSFVVKDPITGKPRQSIGTAYVGAILACFIIWLTFHDLALSSFLTFSAGIQCFGLVCLYLTVEHRQMATGISFNTLLCQGLVISLRLCSTTWLRGYLPVDSTGDWLYQSLDFGALAIIFLLVNSLRNNLRNAYDKQIDSVRILPMIAGCFVLACLVHPDLNDRPIFDTLWTTSLYLDVVSMVPQLWVMNQQKGKIEAITGHYVFLTACARMVSTIFWYYGFIELAPLDGGFNVAGWTILSAHVLQVLLLGDFVCYYLRAVMMRGQLFSEKLDITSASSVLV